VTAPAVQVRGLVKQYRGAAAVDRLDLTIARNEIFGLLGPNGAGKTTTVETLVGLRRPSAGQVRVLGLDPAADRDALRRLVAVQPQQAALLPHLTARETLRLWESLYADPAPAAETLAAVGLTEAGDTRVRRLSGGQERRLLVATALIARPRLLVLDEPSLALDPNARSDVWDVILRYRERGGTVLLTTNSMEEAEALADRVAIMNRGRVVAAGTPAELIAGHAPGAGLDAVFRALTGRPLGPLPGAS
jgi:ABC-2 type transport system ATP-binding protein